jgi:hypothetical protein
MYRHPRLNPFPPVEPMKDVYLDPRIGKLTISERVTNFTRVLKDSYDVDVTCLMLKFNASEAEIVAGASFVFQSRFQCLRSTSRGRSRVAGRPQAS